MNRCFVAALASLLLLTAGCGGSAQPDLTGGTDSGPIDGAMRTRVLRDASGLPQGVQVTWGKSDDAAAYHLYRSSSPIPDSARGNPSFMVSVGGDTLIPNPPGAGLNVFVDDIFPVSIGETWFYRVSALNMDSEESLLSEESQITISPFVVEELLDLSVRVGETFRVRGQNFGSYDPTTDFVQVHGVTWVPGSGFAPAMLDCSVMEWTPSRITCVLPLGATNGVVDVSIAGDTQSTPETLDNADPYITSLTPLAGDVTGTLTLEGAHFGVGPSPDNRVVFNGADPAAADYISYSDNQIVLDVPQLVVFDEYSVSVRCFVPAVGGERDSNLGFFDFQNAPPVVYLAALPPAGNAPLDVTFSPSADIDGTGVMVYSFDPDGSPLTKYSYDFENDGVDDLSLTTEADVLHQYAVKGTYTCRLTCVDVAGASSSTTVDVVAGTQLPIAQINAVPQSGHAPLQVSFDAAGSSDPDGVIVKYEWDFDGDGTYDLDTGGGNKCSHWYNSQGTYNALVRVTDNDGATDTATAAIDVQAGSGNPILLIRNDGGLYGINYSALKSDLDALSAGYDELSYYDTIGDGFAGGGYRLAIWYRGGPGSVDEPNPYITPWTDAEVDNYLQIMQDGDYVLLMSQSHGITEGNEASFVNGWSGFYRFNLLSDTLTTAQKRHAWAAGLATNQLITVAGLPSSLSTSPDNFRGPIQGTHFSADSAGCAERYNGAGSSGIVPITLSVGSGQFCGVGYNSAMLPPEARAGSFQAGLYVDPLFAGVDAGALSWGNSQAPDENIGDGPAYNHVDGPGKLWILGYSWANVSVSDPASMSRSAVLKNIVAWFAPDLLP